MKEIPNLSSLWKSQKDCIIQINSKGIIVNWNIGAKKLFGYNYNEITGKPISVLFLPMKGKNNFPPPKKIQYKKKFYYSEIEMKDKAGNEKNVTATIFPINDNLDKII